MYKKVDVLFVLDFFLSKKKKSLIIYLQKRKKNA